MPPSDLSSDGCSVLGCASGCPASEDGSSADAAALSSAAASIFSVNSSFTCASFSSIVSPFNHNNLNQTASYSYSSLLQCRSYPCLRCIHKHRDHPFHPNPMASKRHLHASRQTRAFTWNGIRAVFPFPLQTRLLLRMLATRRILLARHGTSRVRSRVVMLGSVAVTLLSSFVFLLSAERKLQARDNVPFRARQNGTFMPAGKRRRLPGMAFVPFFLLRSRSAFCFVCSLHVAYSAGVLCRGYLISAFCAFFGRLLYLACIETGSWAIFFAASSSEPTAYRTSPPSVSTFP